MLLQDAAFRPRHVVLGDFADLLEEGRPDFVVEESAGQRFLALREAAANFFRESVLREGACDLKPFEIRMSRRDRGRWLTGGFVVSFVFSSCQG
jgi:hypothetical protein